MHTLSADFSKPQAVLCNLFFSYRRDNSFWWSPCSQCKIFQHSVLCFQALYMCSNSKLGRKFHLLFVPFAIFFGLNNLQAIDYICFILLNIILDVNLTVYWCKQCTITYLLLTSKEKKKFNLCWNNKRLFREKEKGKTWDKDYNISLIAQKAE